MKLTITTFLTLDGVMQGPGGADEDPSGGFAQGGWSIPYADEDFGRLVSDWFGLADAFLLGRRTYELFTSFWPHVTDDGEPDIDVARKLNASPKYVVSDSLASVDWQNTTLIRGAQAVEEIRKLKGSPGRELQVHGSGQLAQTLMAHDLIDEYRLWIYPVVLGNGKRLFPHGATAAALRLVDTKTTGAGVAVHVYEPAGRPTFASIPRRE